MKKELTKEEKAARNKKRLESYNPVMAARNAFRREFSRSPYVIELMNNPATKRHAPKFNKDGTRAKVDAVEHLCNVCGEWKRSKKGSKVAIDHVIPVIDPQVGFVDFNTYFARMWCDLSNLQKICGDCHQAKTNAERFQKSLKEELPILDALEACTDKQTLKDGLKRFTTKKLVKYPYSESFIERVRALQAKVKTL